MVADEILPQALPAIVLGSGEDTAEVVRLVGELVEDFVPGLQPIFRHGYLAGDAGDQLVDPGAPATAPAVSAVDGLRAWLAEVRSTEAVRAARERGIEPGLGGPDPHFPVRVYLLFAADQIDQLSAAATAIDQAWRPECPDLRLIALGVLRGAPAQFDPDAVAAALAPLSGASNCLSGGVGLFCPQCSNNTVLGDGTAALDEAVAALTFAAVVPAVGGGEWLMDRGGAEATAPWTAGLGLVAVPLRRIEAALGLALAADLMATLRAEADDGEDQEVDPEALAREVGESAVWRALFADLEADCGEGPPDYPVQVHTGQMRLDCPRDPTEWATYLAEYDAQWGALVATRWIRDLRRHATEEDHRLHDWLTAQADAVVAEKDRPLQRLAALIEQMRAFLEEKWQCHRVQEGQERRISLDDHRTKLEAAVAALPSVTALVVRAFLAALLLGWLGSGAALAWRWERMTLASFALGAAGLGIFGVAVAAWWCYQAALRRAEKARDDYIRALQIKYSALLRAEALRRLQAIRRGLLARLRRMGEEIGKMRGRLEAAEAAAREAAAQFAPPRSSLIEPVVPNWEKLCPAVGDLWGHDDLVRRARAMLTTAGLCSYQALRAAALPEFMVEDRRPPRDPLREVSDPLSRKLAAAARTQARELGERRLRRVSYYVRLHRDDAGLQQWLDDKRRELERTAGGLLWPQVQGSVTSHRILPTDDPAASSAGPAPGTVQVAGFFGVVRLQEVQP